MYTLPLPKTAETARHTANNFDFLRFFLAVMVIYSHCFALCNLPEWEPLAQLTRQQTSLGAIAVKGFFTISGFLITASWLRSRGFRDYLQKRILRIYPAFVAVCLLCALVVGPLAADSAIAYFHGFRALGFVRHMLLLDKLALPTTFTHNPQPNQVNGSLWTIKIEFECYLLAALLGAFQAFKQRIMPLGLLLLGSLALLFSTLPAATPILSRLPASFTEHFLFFLYFLAGMVFFLYRDRIVYRPAWLLGAILLLALASRTNHLEALIPLPLVYVVMYAAFRGPTFLAAFGQKRDLSYGLYLYAWPVQQLLVTHLHGAWRPYVLFLTAFPLTLACAWASWHLIERPCLNLKSKRSLPDHLEGSSTKPLLTPAAVSPLVPSQVEEG